MAPKLYREALISEKSKHWYWKSSYRNSAYRHIDVENIERLNHIKPIRLKSHIEPALTQAIKFYAFYK